MKLFSGSANQSLAEKVAKELHISLSSLEIHVFPDGEKRIMIVDKVVDEDTIVIQPTAPPVDQNYMELFLIIDALKRSGAKKITAVVPYLGYQRQDHVFREGEAVSLEVIIKILESIGIDRLISFDLHSIRIPELFKITFNHLSALPLFAEKIREAGWDDMYTILVSPDMGGIRRIKLLSQLLDNMPYVAIEKNRDLLTGRVTAGNITGEVRRRAIIIDDMISSGSTIVAGAKVLREQGAKEIIVFATHPVFSVNAPYVLQESMVETIYVTDTIDIPSEKKFSKLSVLSVSHLIAQSLMQ